MARILSVLCMLVLLVATACGGASPAEKLPPGDATQGGQLFTQSVNGAPACSTCHTLDGSTLVGPSMQGYATRAATRIAGMSASDYTRASITQPSAFVVSGFGNLMYTQYAKQISPQQIADLIAYLLTL